ncbi:MAG: polyprenyl synthetase family protein [Deltaproteobacteria bacterium]
MPPKIETAASEPVMHIQEVFDLVKDDLTEMEDGFRKNINSGVQLVSKVGQYILKSGGKRFRPMVLLLSSRLCGYSGDKHIPLAGVIELIHTATLLHDDVVDNAGLRRGSATANTVWGDGASILVGDYMLSKAFAIAVANNDIQVLSVLSQTTTRMAEGEVLQLLKHADTATTEAEYLEMVTNKTGVLISAAAEIPAIISEQPFEKQAALASFGLGLGIAYQLMDDCLDYISTAEDLGKAVGNDLREGKVTMPFIHAAKRAVGDELAHLKKSIGSNDMSDDGLSGVLDIINRHKGIEYTVQRARGYIADAKKDIEIFAPDMERAALIAVADFVIDRKY